MFVILRSFIVFLFITTFLLVGRAETPDLKLLPSSEVERGDAFVEAWIVLRNHLDSLSSMEVHPAILQLWFEAMPGFLARDVARLATDPEVIVAATKRLIDLGGEANRKVANEIAAAHKDNHVARALRSIREKSAKTSKAIDLKRRALRHAFPHHYKMFLQKERTVSPFDVEHGMYETWLSVISGAVEVGARNTSEIVAVIKSRMANQRGTGDAEVIRRQLQALVDFWVNVDKRIGNKVSAPSEIKNFTEAMSAIRSPNQRGENKPLVDGYRVSAAIALCASLGKSLGYDKLNYHRDDLSVLTPGAGRAFDGNLATSWYVTSGKLLVLLNKTGLPPKGLWIANFCPDNRETKISSLHITGRNANSSWTKKAHPKLDTDYFQYIALPGKNANRIEIEIGTIRGSPPSCIAEIRLDRN